jgi:GNAT superfamily N-acetyltransferase
LNYRIRRFEAAPDFLDRAGPWLLQGEAENNLILSVADRLCRSTRGYDPPIYLATIEQHDDVVGCAMRTPQFKLLITRLPPDGAPALIRDVAEVYPSIPAVLGPGQSAAECAQLWAAGHGVRARAGMHQRIYQLERVIPPAHPAPGTLRVAEASDLDLVTEWVGSFIRAAGMSTSRVRALAEDRVSEAALFLWCDDGPKSMAAWSGSTPNGVRIGYVYTPAQYRGRGYASTLTAAVSQRALDAGRRFCFLFTDLANPVSNSIYQRIGYAPVGDVVDWVIG